MSKYPIFKKTRIAPTPSGYLHLGNVLSFAVTAALAKKTNAKVLLRIDDFDRERTNKIFVQDIFDTLNFLEIPVDEGPKNIQEYEQQFSQVHRTEMYDKALRQLKESRTIFACTCSRTDVLRLNADSTYTGTCRRKNISLDSENVSWRLQTNGTKELAVKVLDGETIKTVLPANMQDFTVRRKDRFPAYQLISLIDDLYFGIDLVVRGEDLWPSTLAQNYLSLVLNQQAFQSTTFYHHPLMIDAQGHKLSKTTGAPSIQYFRKQHKTPGDIYALIAGILGLDATTQTWQGLVNLLDLKIGGDVRRSE